MTDIAFATCGRVKPAAVLDEIVEFAMERGELFDVYFHVEQFGVEEFGHMAAGRGALVAKVNDAGNLVEGEPRRLGIADELQPPLVDVGVDAVAVVGP